MQVIELGEGETNDAKLMRKLQDIIKNKDDGINPIIHHLILQKELEDDIDLEINVNELLKPQNDSVHKKRTHFVALYY